MDTAESGAVSDQFCAFFDGPDQFSRFRINLHFHRFRKKIVKMTEFVDSPTSIDECLLYKKVSTDSKEQMDVKKVEFLKFFPSVQDIDKGIASVFDTKREMDEYIRSDVSKRIFIDNSASGGREKVYKCKDCTSFFLKARKKKKLGKWIILCNLTNCVEHFSFVDVGGNSFREICAGAPRKATVRSPGLRNGSDSDLRRHQHPYAVKSSWSYQCHLTLVCYTLTRRSRITRTGQANLMTMTIHAEGKIEYRRMTMKL